MNDDMKFVMRIRKRKWKELFRKYEHPRKKKSSSSDENQNTTEVTEKEQEMLENILGIYVNTPRLARLASSKENQCKKIGWIPSNTLRTSNENVDTKFGKIPQVQLTKHQKHDKTQTISPTKNTSFEITQQQENLIKHIEIELKSELKTVLISRIIAKLLGSDEFHQWHEQTKIEMERLASILSLDDVHFYVNYITQNIMASDEDPSKYEQLKGSTFKQLLWRQQILKEMDPQNSKEWTRLSHYLQKEMCHLTKTIPTEYIIRYTVHVIQDFKNSLQNSLKQHRKTSSVLK